MLQGLLISCNQMSAEYLFMTDKLYDVQYDTGDKVIQCGRHNDIFKLWLQWRAKVNDCDWMASGETRVDVRFKIAYVIFGECRKMSTVRIAFDDWQYASFEVENLYLGTGDKEL